MSREHGVPSRRKTDANTTGKQRVRVPGIDAIAVDKRSVSGPPQTPRSKKSPKVACIGCGDVGDARKIDYLTGKCKAPASCAKRAREQAKINLQVNRIRWNLSVAPRRRMGNIGSFNAKHPRNPKGSHLGGKFRRK
jgi:hypothetical protein